MNHIVKADAPGFIWLIVGVFWVIAQIAGAAAKKNQPRPPLSGTGEDRKTSGDPIAELLRKMAGAEEFRVEPPPHFAAEQNESPVSVSVSPWKPGDIEALPDIKPLRHTSPAPETAARPLKVPGTDFRPKMSAFRSSVPSIKLPGMTLSFQGSETSVRKVQNIGTILNPDDKKTLRRAMLSHIIFSPPKALEQTVK